MGGWKEVLAEVGGRLLEELFKSWLLPQIESWAKDLPIDPEKVELAGGLLFLSLGLGLLLYRQRPALKTLRLRLSGHRPTEAP